MYSAQTFEFRVQFTSKDFRVQIQNGICHLLLQNENFAAQQFGREAGVMIILSHVVLSYVRIY